MSQGSLPKVWGWKAIGLGKPVWSKSEVKVCPNPENLVLRPVEVRTVPSLLWVDMLQCL